MKPEFVWPCPQCKTPITFLYRRDTSLPSGYELYTWTECPCQHDDNDPDGIDWEYLTEVLFDQMEEIEHWTPEEFEEELSRQRWAQLVRDGVARPFPELAEVR